MSRLRLIHWNAEESQERAERLRALGHEVEAGEMAKDAYRGLFAEPPDAVVIDLSRLPSHGREVASGLRSTKKTRAVPLVFVGGEPEAVEKTRALIPDATYAATWRGLAGALKRALASPPANPVATPSALVGYSGTPLPKKLGIKEGSVVALVNAPEGFEATLGALPDGARTVRNPKGDRDLTLWFLTRRADLERGVAGMVRFGATGLWIVWPKKASGVVSDLTETIVREVGLAAGLVDFKVCAVDATWSGLRFAIRKKTPPA